MHTHKFLSRLMKNKEAKVCISILCALFLVGLYAPFFATSKPLLVIDQNKWSSPFFKSLFCTHYYTKDTDLFCNLLMFLLPIFLICYKLFKAKFWKVVAVGAIVQCLSFVALFNFAIPWFEHRAFETQNLIVKSEVQKQGKEPFKFYLSSLGVKHHWQENVVLSSDSQASVRYNGQSLWASLLFGIRSSFIIALGASALAFTWGIFLGAISGYFGSWIDFLIGRFIEVWESMPPLFLILWIVYNCQSLSVLWVVIALALFGWTAVARLVRLEVIKQKKAPYVELLIGQGYRSGDILLFHILFKTFPYLITLIPFSLIGAITYEAALSFLGVGDRTRCSLGLLIDEARISYPMEPKLFWPPALVLISILFLLTKIGDLSKKALQSENSKL